MAVNKVSLASGEILIDLSGDTVSPETLLSGTTAHNAAGEQIVGTAGFSAQGGTATLLTSGWTEGSDGRYAQTISVEGVEADTEVILVDVLLTGEDLDADATVMDAWALPSANNVTQAAGTLTFYSYDLPEVNIPIQVAIL